MGGAKPGAPSEQEVPAGRPSSFLGCLQHLPDKLSKNVLD